MAITTLTYTPPIRRRALPAPLDYELIDAATELFSSGSYLESVHKVFAHILPKNAPVDLAKEPATFTQGSSKVLAKVVDNIFFLSTPLVKLPSGGGAVAALRYILSEINASGQLYQARLHGDDVMIEFSEKLSALHPQKLLEVLRRMPVEADQHDDWMITQFSATALDRGTIEPLNADEAAKVETLWRMHWSDVEELLKEAQRKRSMFFLNELTSFAISRIRFAIPLGGTVAPRFMNAANTFNDPDIDPMKREAVLGKCIKEMKALTTDELTKSLGHIEYAISPLADGTPGRISGFLDSSSNYMEAVDDLRKGQSLDATLALTGTYYYLLANHAWPAEIEGELRKGLESVSGKPWREAANTLFTHAKMVADTYGGEDEDDDEDDEEEEGDEDGDEDGEEDEEEDAQ